MWDFDRHMAPGQSQQRIAIECLTFRTPAIKGNILDIVHGRSHRPFVVQVGARPLAVSVLEQCEILGGCYKCPVFSESQTALLRVFLQAHWPHLEIARFTEVRGTVSISVRTGGGQGMNSADCGGQILSFRMMQGAKIG